MVIWISGKKLNEYFVIIYDYESHHVCTIRVNMFDVFEASIGICLSKRAPSLIIQYDIIIFHSKQSYVYSVNSSCKYWMFAERARWFSPREISCQQKIQQNRKTDTEAKRRKYIQCKLAMAKQKAWLCRAEKTLSYRCQVIIRYSVLGNVISAKSLFVRQRWWIIPIIKMYVKKM